MVLPSAMLGLRYYSCKFPAASGPRIMWHAQLLQDPRVKRSGHFTDSCPRCACRHYTFYLWKDFLGVHPGAKFTLLPVYMYTAWSVWHSLVRGALPMLGILGLGAASCLALIPAWLLDFR